MSFNRDQEEYSLTDIIEIGAENFFEHLDAAPLVIVRSREGNIVLANSERIAQLTQSPGSTKLSAHEWSQLNASEKVNQARFGTKNNPTLYASVVTHDLPHSPQPQKNLTVQDVRKIKTNNKPQCFKYVILEDGKLIVTNRVVTMISPDNKNLVRQVPVKHPRVAATGTPSNKISKNWPLVAAAGDVYINNGKIVKIDDRSGHYLPKAQPQFVEHVFRRDGFKEVNNTFISMTHTLNEWRTVHPTKRIRSDLVFRHLQTDSYPSALSRPLVMSDIDNLRHQQQTNPLKRLLNIPNKTATIDAEIVSTYLRNKFWSERIVTPITPTATMRWVPVTKTAAPYMIGAAFMGVEIWGQHQLNPQGHYIRDGIIGFGIDSIVYYPLFAALGPAGIPLIIAACLPDGQQALSYAYDAVKTHKPNTVSESFHHAALVDNLIGTGATVMWRETAHAILRPFAKKSEEIKDEAKKIGLLDTLKPAPVTVQTPAEFKAMLDSQPLISTTPITFTYAEFGSQLSGMANNGYASDLTHVPWASLGPKNRLDNNPIGAAISHANFNTTHGLDTEISNVILSSPNLNPAQAAAVAELLANRNPTNYKAPNPAAGASTIALQSVQLGICGAVVAGVAFGYEWGKKHHKEKGQKYLKDIRNKSREAQEALAAFNNKNAEINNLPEPRNCAELNLRYTKFDEAKSLLEIAKRKFKSLDEKTHKDCRHATDSNFYGQSISGAEYEQVKNIHHATQKLIGEERHGTGLYATRNTINSNMHAIARELPNQAIVDNVNAHFANYNNLNTTMQDAIQQFAAGKINVSELCNSLQAFIDSGNQIQHVIIPTARTQLNNAPQAISTFDDCVNKTIDLKTSAAITVASMLYNKHFMEKDVNGHIKVDPAQSHLISTLLKPYSAIPEVNGITDLMQATLHYSFTKRCEQVQTDISTQTKSLIENLKTVHELELEANLVADKPEFNPVLQIPLQQLQATAKTATLKEYQELLNTDKKSAADHLLAQGSLSASEQQALTAAAEKFLAAQNQQKLELAKAATRQEYQQLINADKKSAADDLLKQSLLSASEQQALNMAAEEFLTEQNQQKLELANAATRNEYQQLINVDKKSAADDLLRQSLLSASEQQEISAATEKYFAEQYQKKLTLMIDTGVEAVRLTQNLLNVVDELQPSHPVSAPSISTARMRPISSVFWQAPPVKKQTSSRQTISVKDVPSSLQIKKPADVKVRNVRL